MLAAHHTAHDSPPETRLPGQFPQRPAVRRECENPFDVVRSEHRQADFQVARHPYFSQRWLTKIAPRPPPSRADRREANSFHILAPRRVAE